MSAAPLLSEDELKEVEAFLRESYFSLAESRPAGRPRNASKAVGGEVERLKKRARPAAAVKLTEEDLEDLQSAAESEYATEFSAVRKATIERLEKEVAVPASLKKRSLAAIFLTTAARKLCAKQKRSGVAGFTISASALVVLMNRLGIDPAFAPVAVWFGCKIRDVGVPSLCDAIRQYLKQPSTG